MEPPRAGETPRQTLPYGGAVAGPAVKFIVEKGKAKELLAEQGELF